MGKGVLLQRTYTNRELKQRRRQRQRKRQPKIYLYFICATLRLLQLAQLLQKYYLGNKLVRVAYKLRKKMKNSPSCVHVLHKNLSHRHTWRFYTPITANLIASENRKRFSAPITADTLGNFFTDRGDVAVLKSYVIKSPNLMG